MSSADSSDLRLHRGAPTLAEPYVAVALKVGAQGQNHTGLCWSEGAPHLLHLAWHHDLRHEPAPAHYVYVRTDIHPLRVPAVAGLCRLIARNRNSIPYALRLPPRCFDPETGQWLHDAIGQGLTCASFVVAVFQAASFDLLDTAAWPPRPEDELWQQRVVEALRDNGDPRQALHVEQEVGCARYRPEEVAGAALEPHRQWPVGAARAGVLSTIVLEFAASP